MPTPEPQRVRCPYCGKHVLVCKDRTLRMHNLERSMALCDGSSLRVSRDGRLLRKGAAETTARAAYVPCAWCQRHIAMRRDGRLRAHAPTGTRGAPRCAGSGHAPDHTPAT